jgi:hypothetical protein
MSINELTPPTKRDHDALVDRYREASAQLNESPSPRIRAAVLAEAARHAEAAVRAETAQLTHQTSAPKHDELFKKKRAANDSMWRYATAASVIIAGVAAFIINQWQSGDAELVVGEPSIAVSAPSTASSVVGKAGDAIPASVATTEAPRQPGVVSANDASASTTTMSSASESVVATAGTNRAANSEQKKESRIAGDVSPARDRDVGAPAAARAPISVEITPSRSAAAPIESGGASGNLSNDVATLSAPTSAVAASASITQAAPLPAAAPVMESVIANRAEPPSVARSAPASASASTAMNASPPLQRKSATQSTVASDTVADASSAAIARAHVAPGAAAPAQRVGETSERTRQIVSRQQANESLSKGVRDHNVNIVRDAIRAGADANFVGANGTPILSIAVQQGAVEIAIELLRAGADPTRRDSAGLTALDYAERREDRALLDALRK